jgi:HTH-type transcriptional repressor of NAD biosynthesis genes
MIPITRDIVAPLAGEKVQNGLVFGKFMPPTNGHLYLIDFAKASCVHLTIMVLSLPDEPIAGELRYNWIREIYPDCTVIHHTALMPQEPQSPHDIPFYHAWCDTLRRHAPAGVTFDALFASESYGYQVAWALGCKFIPVDTARGRVEISGTALRRDPWRYWDFLHPVVRPYFLKKIAVVGGDAAVRRDLVQSLARAYRTVAAGDYAASFAADLARNLHDGPAVLLAEDTPTVLRGYRAGKAALEKQANRVLFCDADDALTRGAPPDEYDAYLVLDANAAWEQKAKTLGIPALRMAGHDLTEALQSLRAVLPAPPAAV